MSVHTPVDSSKSAPYGLRPGAEEFPLQVIVSVIYPCNLGCPYCPYTDGNSDIRKFYHEHQGDIIPPQLFRKIAEECAPYGAFIRCTGGGEPTLHPNYFELVEYAKSIGARIWLNTNGSFLGPHHAKTKNNLERLIDCQIDLIEFSVDAADAATYDVARPPRRGKGAPKRFENLVNGVRYALEYRKQIKSKTRVVTSIIMHDLIKDKAQETVDFWLKNIEVDEVITRKYLTWDNNTTLDTHHSLDPNLYTKTENLIPPCVWPFERLNVDTLGRIALCGQDIAFTTAPLFPNLNQTTIKEIWQGKIFSLYREKHLGGRGEEVRPCNNCSAWKAGIRDWGHGWLKVLNTAEKHRQQTLSASDIAEVGVDTEVYSQEKRP